MRVAELADLTGTTVRAVRHYHAVGILPVPQARTGWRDYGLVHVARVSRIRWLSEAGLSLARIRELLATAPATDADTDARVGILSDLRAALAALEDQLARLQDQRDRLTRLVEVADSGRPLTPMAPAAADFYDRLASAAPDERTRRAVHEERDFVELAYYRGVMPAEAGLLFITLGGGLLRSHDALTRRLRVRTVAGLTTRLELGTVAMWATGVNVGAALLTAMGSSVVASARHGDISGGFLAEQLREGDPATAYLGYAARVIGILVAAFAVLAVQAGASDERTGIIEHVRGTGASPTAPLRARGVVAVAGALLVLTLAGCAAAVAAATSLGADRAAGDALRGILGQWPAAVALAGATMLLAGLGPRSAPLAWLPLGLSVLLTMLGGLLRLPDSLTRLSVLGHAPDSRQLGELVPSGLLLGVGLVLASAGLLAVAHRDETIG